MIARVWVVQNKKIQHRALNCVCAVFNDKYTTHKQSKAEQIKANNKKL